MKPSVSNFIVGLLAGILGACLIFAGLGQKSSPTEESSERTLTVAHGLPVTHPVHKGPEDFGTKLAEVSGGTMDVEIYPSKQLGTETEAASERQGLH